MNGSDLLCGRCCYAGTTLCGYYTDDLGSWYTFKHDEQGRALRNNPCLVKGRPFGSCMLDFPVSGCPTCRPRVPPRKDDQG